MSLEKLAEVAVKEEDHAKACALLQRALTISEKLSRDDPTSAAMKRTVWVHHYEIADVLEKQAEGALGLG